jgi:DNA-directed RNA polymerase specialized sigma24 family protein
VRYRSRRVELDGVVYQVRARGERDGPVQVEVRGGGQAAGELVAPADHLAALGLAVVELARVFGGRTWTVAEARRVHRAAYAPWTEEDEARLAAEFAAGRTVEELADLFGRKPSAIKSRLRRLRLLG